jgi:peptide-methionine (R)-S-oxide reductase
MRSNKFRVSSALRSKLVSEQQLSRRSFLIAMSAFPLVAAWTPGVEDVVIVDFNDAGERLGTVKLAKVVKSEAEWRRQLSPLAFQITRQKGTEFPFTGAYWNLHDKGMFRCVCCGTALFLSSAKFDSGTGWPSFWQPIAEENVRHGTPSPGNVESEVTCRRCDAHLGDLFSDGPRPTGLRYCIDSVALRFVKFS